MAKKTKATKKTNKKANKPGKQATFPGVLPKADQRLIDLANELRTVRTTRIRLTEEETEIQDKLLEEMRAAKLEAFEDSGTVVKIVTGKDKVSVKTTKDADGEDEV